MSFPCDARYPLTILIRSRAGVRFSYPIVLFSLCAKVSVLESADAAHGGRFALLTRVFKPPSHAMLQIALSAIVKFGRSRRHLRLNPLHRARSDAKRGPGE